MTRIEWTDATWNPVVGCTHVSPGCANCYAAAFAHRGLHPSHRGLTRYTGRWTGTVRCLPERLDDPLHWRKPRRVFVCSMSDLFHDDVPGQFVGAVERVIDRCPQHTFIILTKRAERMRKIIGKDALPRNVWLGVSCEDQERADERIPLLLRTVAAVKFISVEPLLGPIDLSAHLPGLRWAIVGGESGPNARPCDVAWITSIAEQCKAANVPLFVKQLGARPRRDGAHLVLRDSKGGDPAEWPEHVRMREWPETQS